MTRKLVLISTCAAALMPVAAMAQESGAQEPGAEEPAGQESAVQEPAGIEIGEIVVTANRREELLLNVPLSVSAFDQESLDKQGVRDVNDIARISPGVTLLPSFAGTTNISIRGVSSAIGAGTTGIYIDDTPIQVRGLGQGASSTNAYPAIFDVARVEVLRGPQGTLFGAGSEGGTIRFITPEPGLARYSGYARAELGFTEGGDPTYEGGAAVGGPIIQDRIGFRVSGFYRRDGGWVDRVDPVSRNIIEKNSDDVDTIVLRGALRVAVNDDFTITPSIYYQRIERHDTSEYWRHLSDPGNGRFYNGQGLQQPGIDKYIVYGVAAQYDLGFATVISNTSYFDRKNPTVADYTAFVSELLGQNFLLAHQVGAVSTTTFNNTQKAFTQEVRVQSNSTGPLKWVVGAFYQNSRQAADQSVSTPNIDALTIAAFGGPIAAVFGLPLTQPGNVLFFASDKSKDEQIAGFAQVDYEFIEDLTATVGLRVAKTEFRGSNVQGGPFNGGVSSAQISQSEKPVTPKFGINYKANDAFLLYANAAKGFRTGGGNVPVPVARCVRDLAALGLSAAPASFASDSVWSYDVGAKARIGRGVRFDASAFYIDWSNIQSNVQLTCGFRFTGNLGSATSKGFDVHATIVPVTGLTLDASVAYTNAKFNETVLGGVLPSGARGVLISKGAPLNVHPWTVNVSGEYETPLPFGGDVTGYLHADYSYASGYGTGREMTVRFDPLNTRQDATHLANLRAGVRKENLDLSLFIDNVANSFDRLYVQHATNASGLFEEIAFRPRTYGLTASYRY